MLASAAQCVLFSTFFSKANLATACTSLLVFVFYIPFFLSFFANRYEYTLFTVSASPWSR